MGCPSRLHVLDLGDAERIRLKNPEAFIVDLCSNLSLYKCKCITAIVYVLNNHWAHCVERRGSEVKWGRVHFQAGFVWGTDRGWWVFTERHLDLYSEAIQQQRRGILRHPVERGSVRGPSLRPPGTAGAWAAARLRGGWERVCPQQTQEGLLHLLSCRPTRPSHPSPVPS